MSNHWCVKEGPECVLVLEHEPLGLRLELQDDAGWFVIASERTERHLGYVDPCREREAKIDALALFIRAAERDVQTARNEIRRLEGLV